MRFRNTLIALIVLLIIGGYAFVNYYFSRPEQAKTALNIKPEDIAKVDLKYPDREIEIERKAGGPWMITKPFGVKADQTAANNLARAIADAQITRTVDDKPANLAPFGLDKPQTVVTVATTKGKALPGIEIGKTTPIGFNAYMKFTDKPAVMLTSSAFQSGMNKTADQLRDRELTSFNVDDVKTFTIARDDAPEIEIDREGSQWKIVKPKPYFADQTQVHQILSTLANAKVADFVSDAPTDVSQYGLVKPHLTVTVYTGKEQQSLLFGFKQKEQGKGGIYVRRGERAPVYTVYAWMMNSVDKSLPDLRDKTALRFDPSKVETVKVDSQGEQFALKRAPGGKWDLTANGKTAPADVPVVERFLDQIRDLKGNSIVIDPMTHPEVFGMSAPSVIVDLLDKDGKQIGQLKLSKMQIKPMASAPSQTAKTDYYVTSSQSTAVFSTDDFMFGQLNKKAQEFQVKGPIAAPSAAASPK